MGASPSRLGRLYMYSKDEVFTAQENFATEALRMAIEDDPRPLVEALRRLAGRAKAEQLSLRRGVDCQATTQVALPGGGWLDLVLRLLDERRGVSEVWVEVKIDADETGDQLTHYQDCAAASAYPVWLVTLGHAPLRPTVPNLSWNDLYQCAKHGPPEDRPWLEHRSWKDLRAFLKEQNVADDSLGPISDREAASLEPAYELIQKVSALVVAVHKRLPTVFSPSVAAKLHWRNEGQLINAVGAGFRWSGAMVGTGGPLRYGLTAQDGTAYWEVTVDAKDSTRATVESARRKIDEVTPGFGPDWDRPRSGTVLLVAQSRATKLVTHDAALEWFVARLGEVAFSGILDMLLPDSPVGPQEPPGDPDLAPLA
jgi:hypothetical protein